VTAFGLAKEGAEVTIVEREPDVVASPRASVYLASTLQVLEELGLLQEALSIGAVGYEFNMRFKLTGRIGRMDHRLILDLTPYGYSLHFGQHEPFIDFVQRSLDRVNEHRQWAGLQPVAHNILLSIAAREQSIHMADIHNITHEWWAERIRGQNYQASYISQNVCRFDGDPAGAVDFFMSCDGHRGNILKPEFCCAGFACIIDHYGGHYWTQNFSN